MMTQILSCSSRKELACWPQYAKRLVREAGGKTAIHLDLFGFYVFWTAFYVLRGSQTAAPRSQTPAHGRLAVSSLAHSLGSISREVRWMHAAAL